MRSVDQFIVKPLKGRRYNNTKKIGGIEFIVSTSQEDFKFSNREALVISTPLKYNGPIEKGDILLVHHNVFKFYNDIKGRQKSGKSFFRDDIFFIDSEQFFMYKKNNKWHSYDRYCFVEPISPENSFIMKPTREEPLMGIMRYPNKYLKSKGIEKGDKVSFTPDSEYEFRLEDKKLYRIYDHQITMKL